MDDQRFGDGSDRVLAAVREAVGAVASADVRDQILEDALALAGAQRVPSEPNALRGFVESALADAVDAALGAGSGGLVVDGLRPILARAASTAPPPAPRRSAIPLGPPGPDESGPDEDRAPLANEPSKVVAVAPPFPGDAAPADPPSPGPRAPLTPAWPPAGEESDAAATEEADELELDLDPPAAADPAPSGAPIAPDVDGPGALPLDDPGRADDDDGPRALESDAPPGSIAPPPFAHVDDSAAATDPPSLDPEGATEPAPGRPESGPSLTAPSPDVAALPMPEARAGRRRLSSVEFPAANDDARTGETAAPSPASARSRVPTLQGLPTPLPPSPGQAPAPILFATSDPIEVADLQEALSQTTRHPEAYEIVHVSDSIELLDAARNMAQQGGRPVLVLSGRAPSVTPVTIAAMAPELPEDFHVIVWGRSAEADAASEAPQSRRLAWTRFDTMAPAGTIASTCVELLRTSAA